MPGQVICRPFQGQTVVQRATARLAAAGHTRMNPLARLLIPEQLLSASNTTPFHQFFIDSFLSLSLQPLPRAKPPASLLPPRLLALLI